MKSGNAVGGSVRGAVHIARNKPCQDAMKLYEATDGKSKIGRYSIVCVADGHGSERCPKSDEGALAAVGIAFELLQSVLNDADGAEDARKTFNAHKEIYIPKQLETLWKKRVSALWDEQTEPDGDFSYLLYGTTLLAAAVTDTFIFAAQIGDGDMLLIGADGEARRLFPAAEQNGSETYSLCMDNSWQYVQTQLIRLPEERPLMLLMSTDGYANSFSETEGFLKAGRDIFKLWRENGTEYIRVNIEDWLVRSSEMGSGDDITLALAAVEE